jgi:phosphosulfolactate phosphohydrolase-like enzyme
MDIRIRNGYDATTSNWVPDVRVIIDVFRASTTSLAILEKEPSRYLVANDLDLIRGLLDQSFRLVSEVYDFGIDNSPTLVRQLVVHGEKIIQKTTNLTTALEANYFDSLVLIGCFNNIDAVVHEIFDRKLARIEIIPAGQMTTKEEAPEDSLCAQMMAEKMSQYFTGSNVNPLSLLGNWEEKKKTRDWPQHFIEDIELAVQLNISKAVPMVRKIQAGLFEVTSLGST